MLLDVARLRSQQRIVASMVAETRGLGRGSPGQGGLGQGPETRGLRLGTGV